MRDGDQPRALACAGQGTAHKNASQCWIVAMRLTATSNQLQKRWHGKWAAKPLQQVHCFSDPIAKFTKVSGSEARIRVN